MTTKILIELDVEDLKNICDSEFNPIKCNGCKQNIETLIGCNLHCNFKIKEQNNGNKIVVVKEQVPETFEELKELCKKLGIKVNISEDKIEFPLNEDITFWKNGTIKDCCTDNIAVNRTPAQMWEIIKNLMN